MPPYTINISLWISVPVLPKLCSTLPTAPIPFTRIKLRTSELVLYECDEGYVTSGTVLETALQCENGVWVQIGESITCGEYWLLFGIACMGESINVVSTDCCGIACMGESIRCGKYWFLFGFAYMGESIKCVEYWFLFGFACMGESFKCGRYWLLLVLLVWERVSNVVSTEFLFGFASMGESIKCGKYWLPSGFACMGESIKCGKYWFLFSFACMLFCFSCGDTDCGNFVRDG